MAAIPGVKDEDPRTIFELGEKLGKGAFGAVFKARNKQTSQTVAIKFISVEEDNAVNEVRFFEELFFFFFPSSFFLFPRVRWQKRSKYSTVAITQTLCDIWAATSRRWRKICGL